MSIAIISLTEQGRLLSQRIQAVFPEPQRFCFHKYTDEAAESFTDLSALTAALFPKYRALIFIGACGIAVRMIAPHICSKQNDPAVLVVDLSGRFVIPLLSGHLGGANALANRLADAIGAQAVITTGTDVGGVFSPDSFAAANQLFLRDFSAAKEIAAAALHGEQIGLVSEYPCTNIPPELTCETTPRIGIYIGASAKAPFEVTLHLVPRNLVLGIGCKRGTPEETIAAAVRSTLESGKISIERVCAAASIDLKSDESGLLSYCEKHRIPLHFYSAEELNAVSGDFTGSAFVQKTTGVDNICERSAVRCSGGRLILPKTAMNGVTAAVAEKPVVLDFERNLL